ncbi:hypothetical protein HDU96_003416 [Phlyctochytrium bullatum]|nr:hypothetical protein HDU96_003416 [Phlyctochytrium bullatum]
MQVSLHADAAAHTVLNCVTTTLPSGTVNRGALYHSMRAVEGFKLMGFYYNYVFCTFEDLQQSSLEMQAGLRFAPLCSVELARHTYCVPYPQPDDSDMEPSNTLHVTHLPQSYAKEELVSIGLGFPGYIIARFWTLTGGLSFEGIKFFPKYCYFTFRDIQSATSARKILREETNLVVSFAKVRRHGLVEPTTDETPYSKCMPFGEAPENANAVLTDGPRDSEPEVLPENVQVDDLMEWLASHCKNLE